MADLWAREITPREIIQPVVKVDDPRDKLESCSLSLVSDPVLREKAVSSQYGKQAILPKETVPDAIFPPWEVNPPTFSPQLVETNIAVALRNKAPSRGYGKQLVQAPVHTPPEISPPVLQLKRSTKGEELVAKVPSSSYGSVVPVPATPPPAPAPSFKPVLGHSSTGKQLFTKVRSAYGDANYTPVKGTKHIPNKDRLVERNTLCRDRPSSAPAGGSNLSSGFNSGTKVERPFTARYMMQGSDAKNDAGSPATPGKLNAGNANSKTVKSSSYGVVSVKKAAPPTPEVVSYSFTPSLTVGGLGDDLRSKANSPYRTGGDYVPKRGAKVDVEYSPIWKGTNATPDVMASKADALPTPPRNIELLNKVQPTGYMSGGWTPERGEKKIAKVTAFDFHTGGNQGNHPRAVTPGSTPGSRSNQKTDSTESVVPDAFWPLSTSNSTSSNTPAAIDEADALHESHLEKLIQQEIDAEKGNGK